jgi:hypothetical protein
MFKLRNPVSRMLRPAAVVLPIAKRLILPGAMLICCAGWSESALAQSPAPAPTDATKSAKPAISPFMGAKPAAPKFVPGPPGPGRPPAVAADPNDPPASETPGPNGHVPSKATAATTPFAGRGQNPPTTNTAWGPFLWYWENGGYQNHNEDACAIDLAPSFTFYIQYFYCGWDDCDGGFGANPYRWSFWLYRNGQVYWSQTGVKTNQVWINYPITLPTPLPPGTYHGELKYEKRTFIATWQTVFDTATNAITLLVPPQPNWQAPVPDLRLEVVANPASDTLYQLRGWQVGGNPTLQPQWNVWNSNSSGATGPLVSTTWSSMGSHYVIPSNLNFNQWYLLQYGNYSACYSWNDTKRLIFINK